MRYLLDSNVWIELLRRRRNRAVFQRLDRLPVEQIATSAVVKGELITGAIKSSASSHNLQRVEDLLRIYEVLPFDEAAALHYGQIRAALEKRGLIIGHNDLMIAATALQHGLTLVTHNTREFGRVPGLVVEDWQGP